jgi:hypothetical protein
MTWPRHAQAGRGFFAVATRRNVGYSATMSDTLSTVERAFEIARSGVSPSIDDLKRRLKREGYDSVDAHLTGSSIKRELTLLIKRPRT